MVLVSENEVGMKTGQVYFQTGENDLVMQVPVQVSVSCDYCARNDKEHANIETQPAAK